MRLPDTFTYTALGGRERVARSGVAKLLVVAFLIVMLTLSIPGQLLKWLVTGSGFTKTAPSGDWNYSPDGPWYWVTILVIAFAVVHRLTQNPPATALAVVWRVL